MADVVVTPGRIAPVIATVVDAVITAKPGTPESTADSVGQTANGVPVVQMAVTMVHTASEPVAMRGGRPEVTTPTADFALSTTANRWLCIMLPIAYYFI